ncbi:MAG TPA: hypothetical protein PLP26_12510, partial [Ilumatobacteraceae bacterium]|nr:hypothetical protein [Ilumatobacteraceae bacterium]
VRLPVTHVAVAADAPTAVVLTRLRVDPRDRWRSDPEPTMQREFTLATAHDVAVTATLQRNDRAPESVLDALDHVDGVTSNRHLIGVPSARGIFAADGDAATAWTSPFGAAVGSVLTVPLDGSALTDLGIVQPVDRQHSVITAVRVTAADGTTYDLQVPTPDGEGHSTLAVPQPLAGTRFTLTVTAIDAATTIDRRFGELTTLPVAISELVSSAISPPVDGEPSVERCDDTLLEIDGEPVGLLLPGDDETAMADGQHVSTCQPLQLSAGTHRISTANGLVGGIDVDQLVFDDGVAAAERADPPAVILQRTRTTRTATVAACPTGCWLIMGEGFNTGWAARTGSHSLGPPQQVGGGFNGWWLPPSTTPTTVDIEWQAQRTVTVALAVSGLAVIGCFALAFGRRRTRRPDVPTLPFVADPPRCDRVVWQPAPTRHAVVAAVALVGLTWLLVSPSMAVAALLPAAAIVVVRRPVIAGVSALLLAGAIGARIIQRQVVERFPANAGWPGYWDKLHGPGLLVVVLLVAGALLDRSAPPDTDT